MKKKIETPTREEIVRKNGKNHIVKSCIDHVFVKTKTVLNRGAVLTGKISDHYFTMCWMWSKDKKSKETDEYDREESIIIYNNKKIIQEINQLNWNNLEDIRCPNEIYDNIVQRINNIYDQNKKEKKLQRNKTEKKEGMDDR